MSRGIAMQGADERRRAVVTKPALAVVVGTLLALGGTVLRQPFREGTGRRDGSAPPTANPVTGSEPLAWRWVWTPHYLGKFGSWPRYSIGTYYHRDWRILMAEQVAVLLLGGGLLTFVVRRERRRQAA